MDAYKSFYQNALQEIRDRDDKIFALNIAVARLQWACNQVLESKFETETIGQDVCLQMVAKILKETKEDVDSA